MTELTDNPYKLPWTMKRASLPAGRERSMDVAILNCDGEIIAEVFEILNWNVKVNPSEIAQFILDRANQTERITGSALAETKELLSIWKLTNHEEETA